jgi:hypothetical protein
MECCRGRQVAAGLKDVRTSERKIKGLVTKVYHYFKGLGLEPRKNDFDSLPYRN